MTSTLIDRLTSELRVNDNKISKYFLDQEIANVETQVLFSQLTPSMRTCVIKLSTGHEVIGYAQVLDAANDIESMGNQVAFDNAKNELWKVYGSIAKAIFETQKD